MVLFFVNGIPNYTHTELPSEQIEEQVSMADEEDTEVTINMSEELEQIRSVMQAQQKALLEAAQTAQATAESTLAEVTRQVEVDKQMRHEAAAKVESVVPEKSRILAQHEAEKQEVVARTFLL